MRPVYRGTNPTDEDGEEIVFTRYSHARGELIARIGQYCSYCEMKLDSSLHIEHVQPKKPPGAVENIAERELDWHNFLLACTNCNSTKGNTDVVLADYYWPDSDNTFMALAYSEGGLVSPAVFLDEEQREKAKNIIEITGLDKQPDNDTTASDRRWRNRLETWGIATESKADLAIEDSAAMRRQIIRSAKGHGYWSIWMTVFRDDSDMLVRLIAAFPGTAEDCFNDAGEAVQRPAGQI